MRHNGRCQQDVLLESDSSVRSSCRRVPEPSRFLLRQFGFVQLMRWTGRSRVFNFIRRSGDTYLSQGRIGLSELHTFKNRTAATFTPGALTSDV